MNGAVGELKGVKGWLLLLCLSLAIFDPSAVLVNLFVVTDAARPYFARHPEFFRLILINGIIRIAFSVFSLYAGISLWRCLAGAPAIAGKYLLAVSAYALVTPFIPGLLGAGLYSSAETFAISCLNSLLTIAYAGAWYLYLKRSRRVKATYYRT
ncbi:MAG: DUF2569 family protein [Syntrophorhabdales bacterium]|jgi:hypothetical protein